MDLEKKIESATKFKESGNQLFQQASKIEDEQSRNDLLQKALDAYVEGVSICQTFPANYEDSNQTFKNLKVSLYLNLAATHLKLKQPKRVVWHCDKVLAVEPKNVKALYRKGMALLELEKYAEARIELKKARKLEPQNRDIIDGLDLVDEKTGVSKRKERQMYERAIKKMAEETAKEEASQPAQPAEQSQSFKDTFKQNSLPVNPNIPAGKALKKISKDVDKIDHQVDEIMEQNKIPNMKQIQGWIKTWKSEDFLQNLEVRTWTEVLQQCVETRRSLEKVQPFFKEISDVFSSSVVQQLDQLMRDAEGHPQAVASIQRMRDRAAAVIKKLELQPMIDDLKHVDMLLQNAIQTMKMPSTPPPAQFKNMMDAFGGLGGGRPPQATQSSRPASSSTPSPPMPDIAEMMASMARDSGGRAKSSAREARAKMKAARQASAS